MIQKLYCPWCGAEIVAGQEKCLSCGENLWEVA